MADTMTDMELVFADILTPSQLMDGDLVKINGDIVEVVSIEDDFSGDNYVITYRNDYGEDDIYSCTYDYTFKLYVYVDREE